MLASDGLNLDTLRNVDQLESRAKLRCEAEAGKMVVNLKPCQNVVDYELAAGSHSGSH
jgi:hypothetical protein